MNVVTVGSMNVRLESKPTRNYGYSSASQNNQCPFHERTTVADRRASRDDGLSKQIFVATAL